MFCCIHLLLLMAYKPFSFPCYLVLLEEAATLQGSAVNVVAGDMIVLMTRRRMIWTAREEVILFEEHAEIAFASWRVSAMLWSICCVVLSSTL